MADLASRLAAAEQAVAVTPAVLAECRALVEENEALRRRVAEVSAALAESEAQLGLALTVIRDTDQLVKQQMGSGANYEDLLTSDQRVIHHFATS